MPPAHLPAHFARLAGPIVELRALAKVAGSDIAGICLRFVQDVPEVDALVCGVTRAAELAQLIERSRTVFALPDLDRFAQDDADVLDPSRWLAREAH
jgi:aryl-alcohol dehydrogenase-like predicted oxidoreductase